MQSLFLFITGPSWDCNFLLLCGGYSYIEYHYREVLLYKDNWCGYMSKFTLQCSHGVPSYQYQISLSVKRLVFFCVIYNNVGQSYFICSFYFLPKKAKQIMKLIFLIQFMYVIVILIYYYYLCHFVWEVAREGLGGNQRRMKGI